MKDTRNHVKDRLADLIIDFKMLSSRPIIIIFGPINVNAYT